MAKVVKPSSRLMNFNARIRPRNLLIGCYLNPVFVSREVREVKDYAERAENRNTPRFTASPAVTSSVSPELAGDEPPRARGSAEVLLLDILSLGDPVYYFFRFFLKAVYLLAVVFFFIRMESDQFFIGLYGRFIIFLFFVDNGKCLGNNIICFKR